METP
jgi:hypothetical protein